MEKGPEERERLCEACWELLPQVATPISLPRHEHVCLQVLGQNNRPASHHSRLHSISHSMLTSSLIAMDEPLVTHQPNPALGKKINHFSLSEEAVHSFSLLVYSSAIGELSLYNILSVWRVESPCSHGKMIFHWL